LNLLDSSGAQATLALEILFATGLSAELLAWCWSVLRQPDHPLKDVVLQHLGSIGRFESEAGALVLIEQGLHDDSLRPYALELLHRMVWRGMDTFIPAVSWLTRSEGDVRHLLQFPWRLATIYWQCHDRRSSKEDHRKLFRTNGRVFSETRKWCAC
jgi:hypothetical protein